MMNDKQQLGEDRRMIRRAYRQGRLSAEEISCLQEAGFEFEKKRGRPVICVETGQAFESMTSAARWVGVSRTTIKRVAEDCVCTHEKHFYYADKPKPPDSFFEKPQKNTKKSQIREMAKQKTLEKRNARNKQIVNYYIQVGKTQLEVAEAVGCSLRTVSTVLSAAGITHKDRGTQAHKTNDK